MEVKYLGDYSIMVSFEDGTRGAIQLNDLIEKGVFRELKDPNKFSKVYSTGYSIAWSDELEIDAAAFTRKSPEKNLLNFIIPLLQMPQISFFLGIIIWMFYRDHNPPHFHAVYGEYEALIGMQKQKIFNGKLPPRVLGLLIEWTALHHTELLNNWERAKRQDPLLEIEPLV